MCCLEAIRNEQNQACVDNLMCAVLYKGPGKSAPCMYCLRAAGIGHEQPVGQFSRPLKCRDYDVRCRQWADTAPKTTTTPHQRVVTPTLNHTSCRAVNVAVCRESRPWCMPAGCIDNIAAIPYVSSIRGPG